MRPITAIAVFTSGPTQATTLPGGVVIAAGVEVDDVRVGRVATPAMPSEAGLMEPTVAGTQDSALAVIACVAQFVPDEKKVVVPVKGLPAVGTGVIG